MDLMTVAGDLRRRVTIQARQDTPDGSGGQTIGWTSVATNTPAQIIYAPPAKKGDENYIQGQLHSAVFAVITIRFRPGLNIDASMRVLYGSRTFEIRTVLNIDEYSQFILLQCEEIFSKGTLH